MPAYNELGLFVLLPFYEVLPSVRTLMSLEGLFLVLSSSTTRFELVPRYRFRGRFFNRRHDMTLSDLDWCLTSASDTKMGVWSDSTQPLLPSRHRFFVFFPAGQRRWLFWGGCWGWGGGGVVSGPVSLLVPPHNPHRRAVPNTSRKHFLFLLLQPKVFLVT